jgi:murein DD-endopeptidase MepM/ murein hydrolase activator NlpD
MADLFLEIATEFTQFSLTHLLFSSLLLLMVYLFKAVKPEVQNWKGFWSAVLFISFAFSLLLVIPINLDASPLLPLSVLNIEEVSFTNMSLTVANEEVAHSATQWTDVIAIAWMCVYLLVVVIKSAQLCAVKNQLRRRKQQACEIENYPKTKSSNSIKLLARLARTYDLPVFITKDAVSPYVEQGVRRYLMLSEFSLNRLSEQEFQLVLRHELNHLKQGDGLFNESIQLARILLWFNPFLLMFSSQWYWAMEVSCDNDVLAKKSNLRRTYAQTMLKVLRGSATQDANQKVAAFSSLKQRSLTMRMTNIINPSSNGIKNSFKMLSIGVMSISATFAALGLNASIHQQSNDDDMHISHPLPDARLTASYGATNKFHQFHKGMDLATQLGTPIYSLAQGTVITATEHLDGFKNYGTMVVVDHGNGLQSLYAHLGSLTVKEGEVIKSGQTIGTVGMTGKTTGPHLHLEILKDGKRINPHPYVKPQA